MLFSVSLLGVTGTLFCEDHADPEILGIKCHLPRSCIQEAIWKCPDTPTGLRESVQYSYVTPPKRYFLQLTKFLSFGGDINNVYFHLRFASILSTGHENLLIILN